MSPPRFLPRQKRRLKIDLGPSFPSFTADVSPGGFAVESAVVQRPGTRVEGSISVERHEFPFVGEVSWAQMGDPRMSLRGRMGVRFVEISSEFYALLRTIV